MYGDRKLVCLWFSSISWKGAPSTKENRICGSVNWYRQLRARRMLVLFKDVLLSTTSLGRCDSALLVWLFILDMRQKRVNTPCLWRTWVGEVPLRSLQEKQIRFGDTNSVCKSFITGVSVNCQAVFLFSRMLKMRHRSNKKRHLKQTCQRR